MQGSNDGDGRAATGAEAAARIVLRPIASPFALGFLGLAGASTTVAGLELGWIAASETRQVGLIVLLFAPALQAIACVFGFLGRDAVAATGMGTLAGTWACIGAVEVLSPGASNALGVFLFLASGAVLLSATTALQTKIVPALVMLATAIRFALTGVYEVSASGSWKHAAGYAGLVVAACAIYGAFSIELEDIKARTVLPTLRRGRGRAVIRGPLSTQLQKVAGEAGVREQL